MGGETPLCIYMYISYKQDVPQPRSQLCNMLLSFGLLMHWGPHSQVSKSTRICHLVLPCSRTMEKRRGREGKNLNILTNYASKIKISEFANFAHSLSAALRQTPLFLFGAPWNSQTSPCTLLATWSKHRGMRTGINHVAFNTKCWSRRSDFLLMYIERFRLPCLSDSYPHCSKWFQCLCS